MGRVGETKGGKKGERGKLRRWRLCESSSPGRRSYSVAREVRGEGRAYTGPPVSLKFSRPTPNDPLATPCSTILRLVWPEIRSFVASVSTLSLFKRSQMVLGVRDGFVRLETVFHSPPWLQQEVRFVYDQVLRISAASSRCVQTYSIVVRFSFFHDRARNNARAETRKRRNTRLKTAWSSRPNRMKQQLE